MIAEEHYVSSELLPHTKVIKTARPHQQEALAALSQAAQKQDRYTCVMACGTGKTLVALWHAEQLQARNILVLQMGGYKPFFIRLFIDHPMTDRKWISIRTAK